MYKRSRELFLANFNCLIYRKQAHRPYFFFFFSFIIFILSLHKSLKKFVIVKQSSEHPSKRSALNPGHRNTLSRNKYYKTVNTFH